MVVKEEGGPKRNMSYISPRIGEVWERQVEGHLS
jgi:hypothetical protein